MSSRSVKFPSSGADEIWRRGFPATSSAAFNPTEAINRLAQDLGTGRSPNFDSQSKLPRDFFRKLAMLGKEKNEVSFYFGILHLATELKRDLKDESALTVFHFLKSEKAAPQDLKRQAHEESEAILGGGPTGKRLEYLGGSFLRDSTDYKMIVPMLLGATAFGVFRAGAHSRLAGMGAGIFSRTWGLRFGSALAGTAAEIPIFALTGRALRQSAGEAVLDSTLRDLASSGITLGAMRVFGGLSKHRYFHHPATVASLYFAHKIEEHIGLRKVVEGANIISDTLAAMVSLSVGAHLGHRLLGRGFIRLQQELNLRAKTESVQAWADAKADKSTQPKSGSPYPSRGMSLLLNPLLSPLWMYLAAGGPGGVMSPRLMSTKDTERIKKFFNLFPNLEKSFQETGWVPEKVRDLLYLIENNERNEAYLYRIYESVPNALDGLHKTEWSSEEKYNLILSLAEIGASYESYEALPKVINRLDKFEWGSDQKYRLLTLIAKKGGGFNSSAMDELPTALKELDKTEWNLDQKYHLLTKLAEAAGDNVEVALAFLPDALESLKKTDWSFEQKCRLLTVLAKRGGNFFGVAYRLLKNALEFLNDTTWSMEQKCSLLALMSEKITEIGPVSSWNLSSAFKTLKETGWTSEQKWRLLTIYANSENEFNQAMAFNKKAYDWSRPASHSQVLELIFRFFDGLNDFNRWSIFELFLSDLSPQKTSKVRANKNIFLGIIGPEHFLQHFEFYVHIVERWPRMAFNILEGLLEATKNRIVSKNILEHRQKIIHLIEQTNGFIPSLYTAYLQEGEVFFHKLKKYSKVILNDQLGFVEAEKIIQDHGEDFLLALFQITSPTTGASFVKKEEQLRLLRDGMMIGDLRNHVPESWKNKLESFSLSRGGFTLKKGETVDPEGKLKKLWNQFQSREASKKNDQTTLVKALTKYLQSSRSSEELEKLRKVLFLFAKNSDSLKEKIGGIFGYDYTALTLIEQIFQDKDNLPRILADALENVPTTLLTGKGHEQRIEGDAKGLVKSLIKVWGKKISGRDLPVEKRLDILGRILKAYSEKDIETIILDRSELSDELKEAIRKVVHHGPTLNKKRFISEILSEPLEIIKKEKMKYAYQQSEAIQIGLRAVKSPIFVLHGLTSGVCTATDLSLWEDPDFKLLAITDENKEQAVGYIQVYETEIDNKKYLTLPGINPSAEFLGSVDGKKLFNRLMEKVIAYAEAGGYKGVYIPVEEVIHSNLTDIQKAIQKAGYAVKQIPEVRWNREPEAYPFTEVYVAWER